MAARVKDPQSAGWYDPDEPQPRTIYRDKTGNELLDAIPYREQYTPSEIDSFNQGLFGNLFGGNEDIYYTPEEYMQQDPLRGTLGDQYGQFLRFQATDPNLRAMGSIGESLFASMWPQYSTQYTLGQIPGLGFGDFPQAEGYTPFESFVESRPGKWKAKDWHSNVAKLRNGGFLPFAVSGYADMDHRQRFDQRKTFLAGMDPMLEGALKNLSSQHVYAIIEGMLGVSDLPAALRTWMPQAIRDQVAMLERENPDIRMDKDPWMVLIHFAFNGFDVGGLGYPPVNQKWLDPYTDKSQVQQRAGDRKAVAAANIASEEITKEIVDGTGSAGKDEQETSAVPSATTEKENNTIIKKNIDTFKEGNVNPYPEDSAAWHTWNMEQGKPRPTLSPPAPSDGAKSFFADDTGNPYAEGSFMWREWNKNQGAPVTEIQEEGAPFIPTDPYADTLIDTSGVGVRGEDYDKGLGITPIPTPTTPPIGPPSGLDTMGDIQTGQIPAKPDISNLFQQTEGGLGLVAREGDPTLLNRQPGAYSIFDADTNVHRGTGDLTDEARQYQAAGLPVPEQFAGAPVFNVTGDQPSSLNLGGIPGQGSVNVPLGWVDDTLDYLNRVNPFSRYTPEKTYEGPSRGEFMGGPLPQTTRVAPYPPQTPRGWWDDPSSTGIKGPIDSQFFFSSDPYATYTAGPVIREDEVMTPYTDPFVPVSELTDEQFGLLSGAQKQALMAGTSPSHVYMPQTSVIRSMPADVRKHGSVPSTYDVTYPEIRPFDITPLRFNPDTQVQTIDYRQPTSPTNIGYGGPGVGMGLGFVEPGSFGGYNPGEQWAYGINPQTGLPWAQTGTTAIRQGY